MNVIEKQRKLSEYIICPLCGRGKLIFEDINAADVPIRLIIPGSKRKAKWFIKCNICKQQVGFAFCPYKKTYWPTHVAFMDEIVYNI